MKNKVKKNKLTGAPPDQDVAEEEGPLLEGVVKTKRVSTKKLTKNLLLVQITRRNVRADQHFLQAHHFCHFQVSFFCLASLVALI